MNTTSDTLHVRVTDMRYPVTEDVIRSVFSPIAQPRNIHIVPNPPKGCAVAVVQFNDPRSAEACRQQRDNRCIYSECNRMEIAFTRWDSFVPQAVLGAPPAHVSGPYDHSAPRFENNFGDGGRGGGEYGGRGRGRGMRGGFGANQYQHQQQHPMAPYPQPGVYGGMHQHQHQHQQQQQPPHQMQPMPQAMFAGYPPQNFMPPVAPSIQIGGLPPHQMMGRPPGRGGLQIPAMMPPMGMGMGMNPMMMGMQMNPAMMQQFLAMQQQQQQGGQPPRVPNAFLSVAMLDKDVPLQALFAFCEVWGQVVHIRRNFNKPNILTVKFSNPQEAQLASLCLKHAPFFGSTISGRNFANFVEKGAEPTEEGDPTDASVLSYNFTNSRHRLANTRCKWPASDTLQVWNFQTAVSAEDVHAFFESLGCTPLGVEANEEGHFIAKFPDVATAIKALVWGHEKVCGDERSCVLFVKGEAKPREEQQEAAQEAVAAQED